MCPRRWQHYRGQSTDHQAFRAAGQTSRPADVLIVMDRLLGDQPYRVVSDNAAVATSDWVSGCHARGHLSVWFLPKKWSRLETEIGEKVRLRRGREIRIGGEGATNPIGEDQRDSFKSVLGSGALRGANVALCLSHDGAQMYRVALDAQ
jgi:hypothetical protein